MTQTVNIENFEGPLDLLLQLIESEKLEITSVSLSAVTEPFVAHVRAHQGQIPPEELADFLVVAARLVYLKSRALLPSLTDAALEEGPDLETQLRMYRAFVEAANRLGQMAMSGERSYSRIKRSIRQAAGFAPPVGVTGETLRELYRQVIARLEPLLALPKVAIERVITIEEKIAELTARIRGTLKTSFHNFLAQARDRQEMVVSFLALLELIKQRTVKVQQKKLFEEIQLEYAKP